MKDPATKVSLKLKYPLSFLSLQALRPLLPPDDRYRTPRRWELNQVNSGFLQRYEATWAELQAKGPTEEDRARMQRSAEAMIDIKNFRGYPEDRDACNAGAGGLDLDSESDEGAELAEGKKNK